MCKYDAQIITIFSLLIIIVLFFWSFLYIAPDISITPSNVETSVKAIMEESYYEGQRDAINGDIRIIQVKDTLNNSLKWVWLKSPWDDGTPPIFKP